MKANESAKLIELIEKNDIVSISRFFEGNRSESTWLLRIYPILFIVKFFLFYL